MKGHHHRASLAALALFVCLVISPAASAAAPWDHGIDLSERIARIVRKIQKIVGGKVFGGITSDNIVPGPPKP